ncbi:MAG: MmgE/PrpD family protein [Rhodocyclaceae bacterium]|nr:MmgE/PrpD family protein [Rhodocyclaceae bacterium]MCA3105963.1 MmgE/PrpD family protein [Rhodocyclaceae bacterium]MCA4903595.1 MmgE/PrpD family protein [Rhodocyclaceae bacterium]
MGGETGGDTGGDTGGERGSKRGDERGAAAGGAAEAVTARLAAFVAQADAGAIPEAVLHEGRRCLVNLFGVALHATQDPALPMLLDVLQAEGGRPRATVIGVGRRVPLMHAALANGLLAHLDDFDDTFFPTVLHPSAPTIPAALALAEDRGTDGRSFLAATVLGLEACCRVALSIQQMRHGALWHMTGTAGVFGSVAAAGRLLGLDASTMAVAFGLAGTQAGGLRETFGTMTKAFHPARAAQSGLLAALMAQRGFSSTTRILEGPHGFAQAFAAGAFDAEAIVDGLGERWLLMDNAPKPYASAILSHPMVDAMFALRTQPGVSPAQVVRIGGRVNPLAIRLESRPEPADGLAARLSFQHAMAAAFVDGTCLPAQFTDARVHDPVVAGVRRSVEMTPDPAMPQHGCEVELSLADGRVLRQAIEHATGSPGRPVSDVQLEAKFLALAGTVLTAARARRLLGQLWQVDGLPDVGALAS